MTPSTFWPGKLLGARFKYPALGRSVQGLGIHECSYLLAAGALRASRFPLGHRLRLCIVETVWVDVVLLH